MRALLPMLLLPLFAGCGSLEAYTYTPHEGLWRVASGEVLVDECGVLSEDVVDVGLREIWLEVDQPTHTFHHWVDQSEAAPCGQLGDTFACQPAVEHRSARDDLAFILATATDGWFDSPMDMSGDFSIRLDCQGDGCADFVNQHDLAGFPCTVTGVFDASAVRGVSIEDR